MFTMKDFFDGLCLIKVENGKEHYELMRECKKEGKKWVNGQPVSEEDERACNGLFVFEDHGCGLGLCIGESRKVPNVLYKDVIKNVNNYQIIIDCDGDTTTARMIINGKEVKTAKSKRNPADKFNWKLAADLAFSRLWGEKKAEKPEKQPGVFKVGDRVVCIAKECMNKKIVGEHGRVIFDDKTDNLNLLVEFDVDIGGHNGAGKGKEFHCFWLSAINLRHE